MISSMKAKVKSWFFFSDKAWEDGSSDDDQQTTAHCEWSRASVGSRSSKPLGRECSPVGTASDWHAADTGSTPLCGKGFFSESSFSADSLRCIRTPPCAITRIKICAHVKDPVVHVRLRWIMETLKHPACTEGWVARLCRSWLFPRKATRISHERNFNGTMQM